CGYKWKERFLKEGKEGLCDRKKTPKNSPAKIAQDTILEIIKIKNHRKFWGAKKILELYKTQFPNRKAPNRSTIECILKKAGLQDTKRKRRPTNSGQRIFMPEKANKPNHVWTVDFKGWWYTPEREKVNPLTIRDDFSKYILSIKTLKKGDIPSVKAEFIRLFSIYGLPDVIRSDNGPPFASMQSLWGLTKLSVWWLSLGIKLDRIQPGKPYQNGAHERMHRDMARELQHEIAGNITLFQKLFEQWRIDFNRNRPHEALGMKTPEQVYVKSDKLFDPNADLLISYPYGFKQRQVNDRGYINYNGHLIMIGNPFNGFNVGIKKENDSVSIWFGSNKLGLIDQNLFLIISDPSSYKVHKPRKINKKCYLSNEA
ncbi:integrase core domain-containing protein, partial [Leptospira sp. 85282-16]|uniref:integrase core domain-containing protein n=1 Tax=Leptospira sp. 85282-16 TaxID=2971256 RepID=UPI0021C0FE3E